MDSIDSKHKPEEINLDETLRDIGEKELLNRLKKFMEVGQIDDDTAYLKSSKQNLLINTDVLVENIHFSELTTSPEDIGWKAITANISDLISSGANEILSITVGLVATPDTKWIWVEGVYTGMTKALKKFGGKLVGGDCSKGKEKLLSITAIGTEGKLRLHRGNAKTNDLLVTTGPHGLSRLGLALLRSELINMEIIIPTSLKSLAIAKHQRPEPPIAALRALENCKPIDLPWRAAGIDSSDGLIEAIQSICETSKCKAILNRSNLPISNQWPENNKLDEFCLYGGEDYELIVSLPEEWAKAWIKSMPSLKIIGYIQEGLPKIFWDNGEEINEINNLNFKHF
tara:strand:+ start:1109 stop:2134 length:1026 start_codon:yes stop_codon:yes gene_type:complete